MRSRHYFVCKCIIYNLEITYHSKAIRWHNLRVRLPSCGSDLNFRFKSIAIVLIDAVQSNLAKPAACLRCSMLLLKNAVNSAKVDGAVNLPLGSCCDLTWAASQSLSDPAISLIQQLWRIFSEKPQQTSFVRNPGVFATDIRQEWTINYYSLSNALQSTSQNLSGGYNNRIFSSNHPI